MCVCEWGTVHLYLYIYICVYIYIYTHTYKYVYAYMYVCVCDIVLDMEFIYLLSICIHMVVMYDEICMHINMYVVSFDDLYHGPYR